VNGGVLGKGADQKIPVLSGRTDGVPVPTREGDHRHVGKMVLIVVGEEMTVVVDRREPWLAALLRNATGKLSRALEVNRIVDVGNHGRCFVQARAGVLALRRPGASLPFVRASVEAELPPVAVETIPGHG
jgi:hypothetical protein